MKSTSSGVASARKRSLSAGLAAAAVVVLLASCGTRAQSPTGGETHFLTRCSDDAECGEGLGCWCGLCTRPCAETAECGSLPNAECGPPADGSACSEPEAARICDVGCTTDAECLVLSRSHRCDMGACRAGAAGASCAEAIAGNQVLVIGDSFFGETHQVTAYLEELARSSGVLAGGERYRDYSSIAANTLSFSGRGIEAQYATAVAEAPARVVIMNGGGADLLLGSCDPLSPDCPLIAEAVSAATDLFTRMTADGVERIVYVFYPDYADAALRGEMDVLRSLIESPCSASPSCRWVDLRPTFTDHSAEYLEANGVLPTDSGAQASAQAIWSVMEPGCVAP